MLCNSIWYHTVRRLCRHVFMQWIFIQFCLRAPNLISMLRLISIPFTFRAFLRYILLLRQVLFFYSTSVIIFLVWKIGDYAMFLLSMELGHTATSFIFLIDVCMCFCECECGENAILSWSTPCTQHTVGALIFLVCPHRVKRESQAYGKHTFQTRHLLH